MKSGVLFLLLLSASIFSGLAQENTDTLLARGYAFIDSKKYSEAIAEFDKILKTDKLNERAISGKTNALLLLNKTDEAMSFAKSGISANPSSPHYYYAQGLVNQFNKQYKKAIDDYTQAIQLSKNENIDKILLARAISLIELKYYEDALTDLNTYIINNPSNPSALFQRGRANMLMGMYAQAIVDFNAAVSLTKNNGFLYYNLGMAYLKNNNQADACRNFQTACQMGISDACKIILTDCSKK